jgi:tetratricopeptide (TPR) repeat protein
MAQSVFYCWQSDRVAACNRSLIQDALEGALSDLKGMPQINLNVVLDRDTIGMPGSPDISSTILEKIDQSSAVVADVTIVSGTQEERQSPNPNVLIEVGYAIKSRSFARIILVMNTHFGAVEALPFDIRGKRVLTYCSAPGAETRAPERKRLRSSLKTSLITILGLDENDQEETHVRVDIQTIRKRVLEAYLKPREQLVDSLDDILSILDRQGAVSASEHAALLAEIASSHTTTGNLPYPYLLRLCDKSISIKPTSSAYFTRGYVTERLGLPFESIVSYTKAIELGDTNHSLCYLNIGNRHRDTNNIEIALAFYDKAVELNPSQAGAWWAAAQLALMQNQTERAKKYFLGYLNWFEALPEKFKTDAFAQRAEVARAAITRNQ